MPPPPPGSGGRGTLAGERGVGGHTRTLWYTLYTYTYFVFQTFRSEEPSNEILQKILSYRYQAVKKEEARNT